MTRFLEVFSDTFRVMATTYRDRISTVRSVTLSRSDVTSGRKGRLNTVSNLAAQPDAPSDAELISRVRAGDQAAYGQLFERHREAAHRMARQLVRGPDIDDLISEAFTKVFVQLQRGGGPDVAFRAYLLTSIRRLHVDRTRTNQRVQVTDDLEELDSGVEFVDPATTDFERGAASRAFASLPERWQLVLWHLEVEGQKPADIAPLLGMSPNSVAALAYRAREGLRQAYLQSHLADTADEGCRWTTEHLGAYVRKGLAKRDSAKVESHLDNCHRCTAVYLELTEVNSNLSGLLAPALLGLAAPGYLAAGGTKLGLLLLWPWTKLKEAGAGAQAGAAAAAVTAVVAVAAVAGVFGGGGDDKQATEPSSQQSAPDSSDGSPDDSSDNSPDQSPDKSDESDDSQDSEPPPEEDEAPPDEEPPPVEEEEEETPPVEAPDTPTDVDGDIRGSNVVLSWDAVDGARGYKVYRRASPATAPTGTEVSASATDPVVSAEPVAYTVAAPVSSPVASPSNGPVVSGGAIEETSFRDSSLIDGNEYRYVVTAVGRGEESPVSEPVTATYNPEPAAPTKVRTKERGSGISLRWMANSEPDIDGYRVYRDGNPVGRSTSPRFTDDTAVDGTTYDYALVAIDRSGQKSPESDTSEATFDPAPSAPTRLEANERGSNIKLNWDANDEPDIDGYRVYRNGNRITTADKPRYVDRGAPDGEATYTVTALDESGQESAESDTASADANPGRPSGLDASEVDGGINVTWKPNDDSDIDGYVVLRDGNEVAETSRPRYLDTDVEDGERYAYRIVAVDEAGNESKPSKPAHAAYDPAPDAPTGLNAQVSGSKIKLSWDTSTEPDVDKYNVYRDGTLLESVRRPGYVDANSPHGETTYTVTAVDLSAQESEQSDAATVDRVPDAPTKLKAVEVQGAISLSWDGSVDGDVTAYLVIRNDGKRFRVTTGTSVTDRTAVEGASYSYTVIALDASGQSKASKPQTGMWKAPEAPSGLTARARDDSIELNWNASTGSDVDHYDVYRDSNHIGSSGTTTQFFDSNAVEGTPHTYYVIAVDEAGNASEPSNDASAEIDGAPSKPTGLRWKLTGSVLHFSWDAPQEVDFAYYEVTLDGESLGPTTQPYASDPAHFGTYEHVLRVTAVDDAGNESDTAEVTFTHGDAGARLKSGLDAEDDDASDGGNARPERSGRMEGFDLR